ncbi:MAG TPA: hypothetical protein VFQ39_03745 [Longimicrobium sp.]|nr:hypothetical protein [Longimicrobium sp.]
MSLKIRTLFLAVAGILTSLTLGCTDAGTPVEATPEPAAAVALPPASLDAALASGNSDIIARFRQRPQTTTGWAKAWIGPRGGRMDFLGFSVIVPAGAVDRTTMFSIQVPLDRTGTGRVMAEFGPHNVRFAVPVTVEFPFANTSIEGSASPTVVWWTDAGWVEMGASVTPDGKKLRMSTPHFSTYGTTESNRGGSLLISGG